MVQKPGSIVHVEIASNDLPRTKQFFNTVFGWKMQEMPEMNYTMFQAPGAPHGGITPPQGGMPAGTLNHILSNDIVATARKIEQNGGAILVPKTEIPKIGWFAVFREPGGAVLALYEDMPKPRASRPRPAKKARRSTGRRK